MFCPNCGAAEQSPETYCRQCGTFLPDLTKPAKRKVSPEDHIKANSALTLLSAVVSIALAITLYVMFLGREGTPIIIYITAGFLTALFAWQVQTFWRTRLLKRHFKKQIPPADAMPTLAAAPTPRSLDAADLSNAIPASVTENTTRTLSEKLARDLPKSEH